jgi:fatty acid desaturase
MEDSIAPLLVILLFFSVAIVPPFVYLEISFLVRKNRKKPRLREYLAVSAAVSIGLLLFAECGSQGESGLAFTVVALALIPIIFVAGIPVLWLYQARNRSLFKKVSRLRG